MVAGCTGIFERSLPDQPDDFARIAVGDSLRVGAAEADITPPAAQYLAGFGINRVSTGVHSPLKVRTVVFALGDLMLTVVGVDNLGLQREDVEWIKSGLYGHQKGCVVLCSSHTHAAPDLIGIWGWMFLVSGRDRDYLRQVRVAVAGAVREATERLRPAILLRGEYRLPAVGLVRNSNRAGLFDRRVTVLAARDASTDAPIAALLHMACHPEALRRQNTLVSSDFVGALCDRWQAAGLGQPVFVNGAIGGLVSPQPAGVEGVETMGDGLFDAFQGALERSGPVVVDQIEVRRRDVYLPLKSPAFLVGRLTTVLPRTTYEGLVRSTVGYMRIGSVEVACVPGEMEPAMAARIRQATSKPNLLIFGLADDELGYLLREVDARDREFAYERTMAPSVDTGEHVFRELTGAGSW